MYYSRNEVHDLWDNWGILLDDGLATGYTFLAAINVASKQKPAGIVVAIPVAPNPTRKKKFRFCE